MTLLELNELVTNFNENHKAIRLGKNWDMTIYGNSETYIEVIGPHLKVRNNTYSLFILSIFFIENYKLIKLDNGDYQIYKEEERA